MMPSAKEESREEGRSDWGGIDVDGFLIHLSPFSVSFLLPPNMFLHVTYVCVYPSICLSIDRCRCRYRYIDIDMVPKWHYLLEGRPLVVQLPPLGECSRNPSVSVFQLALL